jgi:uncharacterized protein YndB with AHSA1/START domain
MENKGKTIITIKVKIDKPVEDVWKCWTSPEDITKWNFASDDWHTTKAENDLRTGGSFSSRMEAKDGSMGFDFGGTYNKIILHKLIEYTLGDDRKVKVEFITNGISTEIVESFDAESVNSAERQRAGWQAILDNFKKYCEQK